MRERLTNNLFLKLISIIIAFVVWLVVIDISNPTITQTKTVPIQINGESIITSAGKTYTLNTGNTVSVTYQVRTKDQRKISSENFKVSIDLADLYDITGAVPVKLEVVDNASYIIGSPSVKPSVVNISTEDMQKKEFTLSTRTKGEPASGYSVGTIDLEPNSVYLNGPVSVIGRVSSVGVEIDVSGASEDIKGSTKPVFYDANGNKINIDDSNVYFDNDNIEYSVSMLKGKVLNLNFDVGGDVAKGYRFMGAESSTKSISVVGLPSDLSSLSTVEIPASLLNLNNASSDKTISFDVSEFLPENVTVNGNSQISVTLKVEALNKKSISLNLEDIEEKGHSNLYNYKISPERVTVLVSGVEEELSKISARSLGAKIYYSNLLSGTYTGSLSFSLPEGIEVDSYTPFDIIVSEVGESETSTDTNETETTQESKSSDS